MKIKNYINKFIKQFENINCFNTADIYGFFNTIKPGIKKTTSNWRIYDLAQKGIIQRIGRGKYKLGKVIIFKPEMNNKLLKINKNIKNHFPFIKYCIWSTKSINEFTHHLIKMEINYVEIEKDVIESVYYSLKNKFKLSFLKPDKDLIDSFIIENNKSIIVRTLVSEAPLQNVKGVPTITIEKVLVDLFSDSNFYYYQEQELISIYRNAFSKYTINQSKLLRYANRKRKKEQILNFLNNNNLAAG